MSPLSPAGSARTSRSAASPAPNRGTSCRPLSGSVASRNASMMSCMRLRGPRPPRIRSSAVSADQPVPGSAPPSSREMTAIPGRSGTRCTSTSGTHTSAGAPPWSAPDTVLPRMKVVKRRSRCASRGDIVTDTALSHEAAAARSGTGSTTVATCDCSASWIRYSDAVRRSSRRMNSMASSAVGTHSQPGRGPPPGVRTSWTLSTILIVNGRRKSGDPKQAAGYHGPPSAQGCVSTKACVKMLPCRLVESRPAGTAWRYTLAAVPPMCASGR